MQKPKSFQYGGSKMTAILCRFRTTHADQCSIFYSEGKLKCVKLINWYFSSFYYWNTIRLRHFAVYPSFVISPLPGYRLDSRIFHSSHAAIYPCAFLRSNCSWHSLSLEFGYNCKCLQFVCRVYKHIDSYRFPCQLITVNCYSKLNVIPCCNLTLVKIIMKIFV